MYDLTGRHALVCGASKGIGQATAFAMARQGASLTVLARSEERLRAMLPPLVQAGAAEARAVVADLDDLDSVGNTADRVLKEHGPVHILVHNTGGPPGGRLLDAEPAAILAAIQRHVLSAQILVQRLLPGMAEAGYGRFIQVLSTSVREPIDRLGVSNLTRAAVASWAKTLSRELPPGVTINNVLPGFTDTERLASLAEANGARTQRTPDQVRAAWLATVPEGRLAQPEELGAVIAFLASPAGSYVRGTSIPVDGGRLRSI